MGYDQVGPIAGFVKIQEDGTPIWAKDYGFKGEVIQELPDQSLIIGGHTNIFGSDMDIFLMRIDANGNLIWFKQYAFSGDEMLKDLTVTPTGCIVIAANQNAVTSIIVKTDGSGNLLWGRQIPTSEVNAVENAPGNRYLFGGNFNTPGTNAWAFFLDSLGNYTPYLAFTGGTTFEDVAVTADSTYLFFGNTAYSVVQAGHLIIRKPSTGYSKDYVVNGPYRIIAQHIIPLLSGDFVLRGWDHEQFTGQQNGFSVRFDANEQHISDLVFYAASAGNFGVPWQTKGVATPDGGYAAGISYVSAAPVYYTEPLDTVAPNGEALLYKVVGVNGMCGHLGNTGYGLNPRTPTNATISPVFSAWLPVTMTPTPSISNFTLGSQATSCFACADSVTGSFTSVNSGPNAFTFSASSPNALSISWDFGDGNTGVGNNPTHQYVNSGNYSVCMFLNGPCDTVTICQNITVCNIGAFTGPGDICGPGNGTWVSVLSASTHDWILNGVSVGNGSSLSLSGLPDGEYTLIHVATDGFCSDSDTSHFYISANPPIANFTYNYFNLDFEAVFSGTGPGAISWDFGDGNTALGDSVSHHFALGDTFHICLMIQNGCGADTFCQQIICPLPVADFSTAPVGTNGYQFTDLSFGASTYSWDFGDGGFSNIPNPSHQYFLSGAISATLEVENSCGLDQKVASLYPLVPNASMMTNEQYFAVGRGVTDIFPSPSGGFYLFGRATNQGDLRPTMAKLDDAGNMVWNSIYSTTTTEPDIAGGAFSADNGVYLFGLRGSNGVIFKFNTNGTFLWGKRSTTFTSIRAAFPKANGNMVFWGSQRVVELSPSGTVVNSSFVQPYYTTQPPKRSSDKGYIFAYASGNISKVDSNLVPVWSYQDSASRLVRDFWPLSSGELVIAINYPTVPQAVHLIKFDANMNKVWSQGYMLGFTHEVSLGEDENGNIIVNAYNSTSHDHAVVRLQASNGAVLDGISHLPTSSGVGGHYLKSIHRSGSTYFGAGYAFPNNLGGGTSPYPIVNIMDGFYQGTGCADPFSPTLISSPIQFNPVTLFTVTSTTITTANQSLSVHMPGLDPDSLICRTFCDPDVAPISYTLSGNTLTVLNPDGGIVDLGDGSPTRQDTAFTHTYASLPVTLCNYYYQNCAPAQSCTVLQNLACDTAGIAGGSGGSCPGSQTFTYGGTGVPASITWLLDGNPAGSGTSVTVNLTGGTHTLVQLADYGSCNDSDTLVLTVSDLVPPVAACPPSVLIYLDGNGTATADAWAIGSGSTDNCGIASMAVSPSTFSCNDLGAGGHAADLFFSEYIEGSGQNQAMEIFNGTGRAVDLRAEDYAVRLYYNGATTYTEIPLTGTLADGDVFVFGRYNASPAVLAQTDLGTTLALWTGDDAVELVKGGVTLDIFGRIGEDPGSGWNTGGKVTINRTLVRRPTVTGGVTANPTSGFPALGTEWDMFATDYLADLGIHAYVGGSSPLLTLTVTDSSGNADSCTAPYVVLDTAGPAITCQDITVQVGQDGTVAIAPQDLTASAADNCALGSASVDIQGFDCSNVGAGSPAPTDLFISEYIEGSGQNQAIEIYNGTGGAIDLAAGNYALRIYFNGSTSYSSRPLTGTVAAGDVYVYSRYNASPTVLSQADQTTNLAVWTGDDAIALVKGNTVLDIFGRIGEDPGSAWSTGGKVTISKTLLRNPTVTSGVTVNPSAGFPALGTEWTMLLEDDFTNLGTHGVTVVPSGVLVTLSVADASYNVSTCTAVVEVQANCTARFDTCNSDIVVACPIPGGGAATVAWTAPAAVANCPTCPAPAVTQVAGPASGSLFAQATNTTITYVATIAGGNPDTCSFQVIVPLCKTGPQLGNGLEPEGTLAAGQQQQLEQVDWKPEVFPNPFRESVTFRFDAEAGEQATLTVTDLNGRAVHVRSDEMSESGTAQWNWTAGGVTAGVYFYRLQVGDRVAHGKVEALR